LNEITDDGKYWNHSEEPNTVSGVNGDWDSTFAKRDILAGEVGIRLHALCISRLHLNVINVLRLYTKKNFVLSTPQFIIMDVIRVSIVPNLSIITNFLLTF
jgi:hypothetical protein